MVQAAEPSPEHQTSQQVFLDARKQFLSTLSEDEHSDFEKCSTSAQLIIEVNRFTKLKGRHKAWEKVVDVIQGLSQRIEPYCKVIDTFVQSSPEYSALVWGSIRLILQLATNFPSFFDKLISILDKLSQKLPHYEEILDIPLLRITSRFRISLHKLYTDLFEFFTAVARVFSQKNGRLRRTPIVIGQLLWKPFNIRFDNILDRLQLHQDTLSDELELIWAKSLLQSKLGQEIEFTQAAKHRQREEKYFELLDALKATTTKADLRHTIESIESWLNPPKSQAILGALDDAQRIRIAGTSEWIFSDMNFAAWSLNDHETVAANGPYENMLWVRGNPGTGKSVLASSVLDKLQGSKLFGDDPSLIICYFFSYRNHDTRNPRTAWSLMLSQLLKRLQDNHEVLDYFAFAMSDSSYPSATTSELLCLLQLMAHTLPNLTVLLDGVDECDDPEVVSDLGSIVGGTKAKSILFSRPNVRALALAKLRHIELTRQEVENDIQRYLRLRLDEFHQDDFPDAWPKKRILAQLVESANGMFLWARLMMDYLRQDELDADERAMAIESLSSHETLNDVYLRILRHISNQPMLNREMARQVFLWVTFSLDYLNVEELWEVVNSLRKPSAPPGLRNDISPTPGQAAKFHLSVIMRCGSLVEKRGSGYRFVHHSVAEFFRSGIDEPKCQDPAILQFFTSPKVAHCQLATDCLSYLLFRVPAQPLSGDMRIKVSSEKVNECLPFARYAASCWPTHFKHGLELTQKLPQKGHTVESSLFDVLRMVSQFTSSKLAVMTWIELVYVLNLSNFYRDAVEDSSTLLKPILEEHGLKEFLELPERLHCFHADISALHSQWGPTLSENTHYIWHDVTAFTNSRSFQKTSAVDVHSMVSTEIANSDHCLKPLASISVESSSGKEIAVLSIWPTKIFEELWPRITSDAFSANSCHGWVHIGCARWLGRLETWNVGSEKPEKLNDMCFPLDREDVERHFHTYVAFRRDKRGDKQREKGNLSATDIECVWNQVGDSDDNAVPDQWTLPFPIAIGTDMKMMVILQKIYFVENPSNTVRNQSQHNSHLPQITCICLPEIPREIGTGRVPGLQKKGKATAEVGFALTYSYQISPDSQYLLRQELRCPPTEVMMKDPTTFALTAFHVNQVGQECHVTGRVGSLESIALLKHCSIHPSLPLVVFSIQNCGSDIQLWMFENDCSHHLESNDRSKVMNEQLGVLSTVSSLAKSEHAAEYLQFSACGTKLIFKTYGKPFPEIISITENTQYQLALQKHPQRHSAATETNHIVSMQATTLAEGQSSMIIPDHRMELGQSTLAASSSFNVKMSTGNSQRTIQAVKISEETKATQEIISFPDSWKDIDKSVHVSIEHSTAKENYIRIMLHQSSKPWYLPVDSPEPHFPMMIHKHKDAILPPKHTTPSVGDKRSAEALLDYSEIEVVSEDTRATRRRRRKQRQRRGRVLPALPEYPDFKVSSD